MNSIDPKCLELINADVDGELSDEDAGALQRCLAESEEARALHTQLRALCNRLEAVDLEEPPEDLRPSVMAALGAAPSKPAGNRSWWPVATVVRYAAVFFAGALLTAVLFTVSESPTAFHEDDLVGSMTRQDRFRAPGKPADSFRLNKREVSGDVQLYPVSGGVLMEFDIDSSQAIRLELDLGTAVGTFGGFLQLENQVPTLTADAGSISLTSEGAQHFLIALELTEASAEVVEVRFYTANELIHKGQLRMP